jgi:hypothetical protein
MRHHAIVGAITGCYAGHHMARMVKQHRQQGDEKVPPAAHRHRCPHSGPAGE